MTTPTPEEIQKHLADIVEAGLEDAWYDASRTTPHTNIVRVRDSDLVFEITVRRMR